MLTNKELDNGSTRTDFLSAYLAGKTIVVGMRRWRLYLVVILAIVVGNVVQVWLVSEYSLPRFEVFMLASIFVLLYGLAVGLFLLLAKRRGSRREIP